MIRANVLVYNWIIYVFVTSHVVAQRVSVVYYSKIENKTFKDEQLCRVVDITLY